MNRRKAITRIFLIGAGGVAAYSGYKWYDWHKTPDIAYLEKNKELLAALSETIIPATDSPGAREAGVAEYIIVMIKDCTEIKTKNRFINGLKELSDYSISNYGQPYQNCKPEEQDKIMHHFEKQGRPSRGLIGKVQNRYLGKSFFSTLKEYTVRGYCTSRLGATKALVYLPVPGSYQGNVNLQPGQHSWATN